MCGQAERDERQRLAQEHSIQQSERDRFYQAQLEEQSSKYMSLLREQAASHERQIAALQQKLNSISVSVRT